MTATRYTMTAIAIKTWKTNGVLLRNRQIHGQFMVITVFRKQVCGRWGCGRHGHFCLWSSCFLPSLSNSNPNKSPPVHPYTAIVRSFNHRMMPWKFRDDMSNGSGVIVSTDRQTKSQTDTTENNTIINAKMAKTVNWNQNKYLDITITYIWTCVGDRSADLRVEWQSVTWNIPPHPENSFQWLGLSQCHTYGFSSSPARSLDRRNSMHSEHSVINIQYVTNCSAYVT